MYCPRLDHFVRLNSDGTVGRCGHMVDAPGFASLEDLDSSDWLANIRKSFQVDIWPQECRRCQQTEIENNTSIRLNAIQLDGAETKKDYLQVGGVLDNLCNAGCLTCSPGNSTRIGSLNKGAIPIVNNTDQYWKLPQDRILHLDINGGEPSYSKNYKKLIKNLPPNLKTLRLNTNCSTVLTDLVDLTTRGIKVTVTVSCDGIGSKHELLRWPLSWDEFYKNLMTYKSMPVELNLWTTVSILNVDDLPDIIQFARDHDLDHSYAYLTYPVELDVNNNNRAMAEMYIQKQKQLRGIK